jgi:DnaJ family protein C protein 13
MNDLSNVEACVLVGGCVLAVDLLTVAHETSERTAIPLQSNLIAATAFMEPSKEWMYIDKDGTQVGPLEKDAIRRLWSKKSIDWTTKCWASGMSDWKRLRDIRELRWALSVRVPVLTPTQVFKSAAYGWTHARTCGCAAIFPLLVLAISKHKFFPHKLILHLL